MNINREYRFLSAWTGKTLQEQINALTAKGFILDWRYQSIKHSCWLSKPREN